MQPGMYFLTVSQHMMKYQVLDKRKLGSLRMWIQVLTGVKISIFLDSAANMIYLPRKCFINLAFPKERNDHSPSSSTALAAEQIQQHCSEVSFAWTI